MRTKHVQHQPVSFSEIAPATTRHKDLLVQIVGHDLLIAGGERHLGGINHRHQPLAAQVDLVVAEDVCRNDPRERCERLRGKRLQVSVGVELA